MVDELRSLLAWAKKHHVTIEFYESGMVEIIKHCVHSPEYLGIGKTLLVALRAAKKTNIDVIYESKR